MKNDFMLLITLYCINKFKGERTIFAIFYLLTGKKSSQTISDSSLYGLSDLFGVLRSIKREQVRQSATILLQDKLICEVQPSTNKFVLTNKGQSVLAKRLQERPFPSGLHGWKYATKATLFWQRFSLLTQVLSNLIEGKKSYITIQQDPQLLDWVKSFLSGKKENRIDLSEQLYQECLKCLNLVDDKEASIFVLRLTGANRVGYTFKQIGFLMEEDETWVEILFNHTLHMLLRSIEGNLNDFPLLNFIIHERDESSELTVSSTKTYQYLLQGKSIEEIAMIRRLKRNTIEDHIVEISHNIQDFLIEPFVPKEHKESIISSFKSLKTRQLRQIKEKVGQDISYFEIRLVLSKWSTSHES